MWQYDKAKGPTKAILQIFIQVKFDFCQEIHNSLLFKLWRGSKIHSPLAKINLHKNSKKLLFAKILFQENISRKFISYPRLIWVCLHFKRIKNKMVEVINWICGNNYSHSAGCPNDVLYWQNLLEWNEDERSSKEKANRQHILFIVNVITLSLLQIQISGNENLFRSFPQRKFIFILFHFLFDETQTTRPSKFSYILWICSWFKCLITV